MKEYSVMTLNLLTPRLILPGNESFAKRSASITEMIHQLEPDLIGVQELTRDMFPYLQEILKEYGIFGSPRNSRYNDEYSSILYRRDRFELIGGKTCWLSMTPEKAGSKFLKSQFPRIVTYAYLRDRQNETIFTFANTHLDANFSSVRTKQAEVLADLLIEREKGDFMVLTGDFNCTSESDALSIIGKTGLRDLVDNSFGSTLRGKLGSHLQHQLPIDHIFLSRKAAVTNIRKIQTRYKGMYPTDHYPLIAWFRIS